MHRVLHYVGSYCEPDAQLYEGIDLNPILATALQPCRVNSCVYCEPAFSLSLCCVVCRTKHNLKVREHKTLGPYVEGLSKLAVASFRVRSLYMSLDLCT